MNFLKTLFVKSSATQSAAAKMARKARRLAKSQAVSVFEALETRQMMSASMMSAVSYTELDLVPTQIGAITIPLPQLVQKSAVFSIGPNGQTFESTGPGNLTNLGGGNITQISAGLDVLGRPEVFDLSSNGAVWLNDNGAGWTCLGGNYTQISASNNSMVYGIDSNGNVSANVGFGWSSTNQSARQISAGVTAAGKPEVYAISSTGNLIVNSGSGWVSLGGQVRQISAAINDTVYAIGPANTVYAVHLPSTGSAVWTSLGGSATQINAGIDANGAPEVFAVQSNPGRSGPRVSVNDGNGWVTLGSGTQITAPSFGSFNNSQVSVLGTNGQISSLGASGPTALPLPFTIQPAATNVASWKDVSSNPLFGFGGPSINDVKQGGPGDCYFLAALGNVAFQDPNLIRNDITQRADGTYDVFFHNGSTIVDEHVDGWLPMNSGGAPIGAQLGQGGATWVAIMEKAFCYFRNSTIAPAYANINAGWANESLPDLGATNLQELLPSITSGAQLWADVDAALANHEAVQFGTGPTAGPLVSSHEYSVVAAVFNTSGVEIEVRNPWGTTGPKNDGYLWVNAGSLMSEINEVATATV